MLDDLVAGLTQAVPLKLPTNDRPAVPFARQRLRRIFTARIGADVRSSTTVTSTRKNTVRSVLPFASRQSPGLPTASILSEMDTAVPALATAFGRAAILHCRVS